MIEIQDYEQILDEIKTLFMEASDAL